MPAAARGIDLFDGPRFLRSGGVGISRATDLPA